jgi:hypothetical protein
MISPVHFFRVTTKGQVNSKSYLLLTEIQAYSIHLLGMSLSCKVNHLSLKERLEL